jgi:hypothetical protein
MMVARHRDEGIYPRQGYSFRFTQDAEIFHREGVRPIDDGPVDFAACVVLFPLLAAQLGWTELLSIIGGKPRYRASPSTIRNHAGASKSARNCGSDASLAHGSAGGFRPAGQRLALPHTTRPCFASVR